MDTVVVLKHKGARQKRVAPAAVARLMGAERLPGRVRSRKGPMAVAALREFLHERLRSTGGRPALEGTEEVRRKIRLIKGDMTLLEALAAQISAKTRKVTPIQLLACLVHKNLAELKRSLAPRR